jgi:signal transduction histidine kinase/ligand-binding sensor domain-containing protein
MGEHFKPDRARCPVNRQAGSLPYERSFAIHNGVVFCRLLAHIWRMITPDLFSARSLGWVWLPAGLLWLASVSCPADIIWSDLGATLAHETGPGKDILDGAVKRDDSATYTLYFKFHVNPISDAGTEPYFAAFELYEGDAERLAVGNALNGWAYGAFNVLEVVKTFNVFETGNTNKVTTDWGIDLNSSKPTAAGRGGYYEYELPRTGIERTIVFKVQYVPGGKDLVTVWMDPDLGPGATEASQPASLTTKFAANASFNQIRLRHGGRGDGWTFSEMAIATSFSDFVLDESGIKSGKAGLTIGRGQVPFTFQKWTRQQGLPQSFLRALAQTKDGYIWVGSDAGVSRFDGVSFVSFGLLEGFQAGRVQTLLGDDQGALWIGSVGRGLVRFQNGRFTSFTTQNGLASDSVNALAEDRQGRLWIGTEAGLAVWQKEHLDAVGAAAELAGKPITSLCNDRKGTIWIGAKGAGLFGLRGGQLLQVHDPIFENLLKDPHCLLVDHEGRLWVGAGEDSVLYRKGEQWQRYRLPRHLARNYISSLAEGTDGTVWAGSVSEGLFQFKHGKLVAFNASSGLSDNLVEALLVDREGKLWVGTHEGLNRLRPKNLSVISYNEGLGHGAVQGLAEVSPGKIWASRPSEGLYLWDGRYFRSLPAAGLSPGDGRAGALLMARDGSCWMGGAHGLLQFKDVRSLESEPGSLTLTNLDASVLTNLDVSALAQDAQGRLWAGSRQGELWWKDQGQWQAQRAGPRVHAITALVPERDGSIWVGTDGDGLFSVEGKADGHWKKQGGRFSDWIRTLYLDGENTLWIGTGGGGLSRLKGGTMATFTTREGLPDNTISQILEDDAGNLWLGGDQGIVRVNKRELGDLAAQRITAVYPQVYDRAEGMLSEECISGFFPIGLRTTSGLLWFPTQEGIAVVDPHHPTMETPPPAVVLEETLVDGVPDRSTSLHLGPGKHRLEFRYTGLNFDAPERVRFRYRLMGLDSDWVPAGSSRAASFPYVPYGEYRFEVNAGNGEGDWNTSGASVSVFVKPYLWQTWWFRVPASLALLALIAVTARVVEKRKLQRRLQQLERERALAHERERIARDLHDDLGSSLARISLLSGLLKADRDNPGQIESHAFKISQSADQTVRALEEIVWAVRPGSDSLQSLVEYIAHFANELFDGGGIHCRLDLPPDLPACPLPPEVRHNIFLVVKEALTNAFKHAAAREVRIRAEATVEGLEILVQDDGKGFDTHGQSQGHGLDNMRRRAQALGEELAIESRPGRGTSVRLRLHFAPVHSNGRAVV